MLAVFDYNRSLDDDDKELIQSAGEVPCIAIINKTDLDKQLDTEYIESKIKNVVYLSAKSGEGREELVKAVEKSQEWRISIRARAYSLTKDKDRQCSVR